MFQDSELVGNVKKEKKSVRLIFVWGMQSSMTNRRIGTGVSATVMAFKAFKVFSLCNFCNPNLLFYFCSVFLFPLCIERGKLGNNEQLKSKKNTKKEKIKPKEKTNKFQID
jgi:hypothetical protein